MGDLFFDKSKLMQRLIFGQLMLAPNKFDELTSLLNSLNYEDRLDYWIANYTHYLQGYTGHQRPPLIVTRGNIRPTELISNNHISFVSGLSLKEQEILAVKIVGFESYRELAYNFAANNLALLRKLYVIRLDDCKQAKVDQAIGKEIPHALFEEDCRQGILLELRKNRDNLKQSNTAFYSNLTALINEYTQASKDVPVYPVHLKTIDKKFLAANFKHEDLKKAEIWAIENQYLTTEGVWDKYANDLAAFIQVLVDENILIIPRRSRKEVFDYFSKRYETDSIKDQIKTSKITKEKKNQFYPGLVLALKNSHN